MFFPESERTGPPSADGRTRPPGHSREGASEPEARAGTGGVVTLPRTRLISPLWDKNASFRRIRKSTRCQQKGAVEAAAAVGGQQEPLAGCARHESRLNECHGQPPRRFKFLLTGNPTTNAGEKREFLQAGRRRAVRRAGRAAFCPRRR